MKPTPETTESMRAENAALRAEIATLRDALSQRRGASEERYLDLFAGSSLGILYSTEEGHILDANPSLLEMLGYETHADLAAATGDDVGALYLDAGERAALLTELRTQEWIRGRTVRLRTRIDGVLTAVITARAVPDKDGTAIRYIEEFIEDVTSRTRAERDLLAEIEKLQIIKNINESLGGTLEMSAIYEYVRTQLPQLLSGLGVDSASLLVVERDSDFLTSEDALVHSAVESPSEIHSQPVGFSISGLCIAEMRPILVEDCSNTDIIPQFWVERLGLKTCLAVPIIRNDSPLGVLRLANSVMPNAFPKDSIELFSIVAQQLAPVIENALLFARQRYAEQMLLQADAELQLRHALLQTQQEASPDAIVVVASNGRWISFNQRFLDLWGLDRRALEAGRFDEAIETINSLVADPAAYQERIEQLLAHPDEVAEDKILLKDGRVFNRYTAPARGADGTYYGRVWFSRDETEQRRAEESLRTSAERFRALTEQSLDIVQVFNAQGIIEYQSPSHERLLGYDRDELVGTRTLDHFHPDDMEDGARVLRELSSSPRGTIITFEHRYRLKDGSCRVFESSCVNELDNPAVGGIVVNARDVTGRRIAEDKLLAAKSAAESMASAKSAFLATMSHEIRTPLNGVIGMAQLLLSTPLNNQQRSYANTVCTAADSLLSIINNIMDFSKIEAGMLKLEAIDFDLQETVEAVREIVAARVREKRIGLTITIAPEVPRSVRGDATRLRQVLLNLVSNAVKFTDIGGRVSLLVGCDSADDEGVFRLEFRVIDNGIGISREQLGRLFKPFSQADASTARHYGGSGLGLAISRQIVELMGGEIAVESESGQGSTFSFVVPFAAGSQRRSRRSVADKLRKLRVLIADSHPVDRARIAVTLASWGCTYEEADSGEAAMRLLRDARKNDRPFRVVMADSSLTHGTAKSLAEAIHRDSSLAGTPLFYTSANLDEEDPAELLRLGFEWTLAKPVQPSQLLNALLGLAADGTGATSAPEPPLQMRPLIHLRILVSEDNTINQQVALNILQREGFTVQLAENGQEALDRLASGEHFDLVLMDCQMPVMDGFEATRRIRAGETGSRHIPIIAMTAEALQGDRERCLAAGMDDYLAKPILVDELLAAVKRWSPTSAFTLSRGTTVQAPRPAADELPAGLEEDATGRESDTEPLGDESAPAASLSYLKQAISTPEELGRLIGVFIEQGTKHLDNIERALRDKNAKDARYHAHTLKGSALNYHAERLSWLAHRAEIAAADGKLGAVLDVLKPLRSEFQRVKECLLEENAI